MELGLWLCPAEVGPMLRLGYTNQPLHERMRIAMQPIPFEKRMSARSIFLVGNGNKGLWLGSEEIEPDDFYSVCNTLGALSLFVFIKPRQPLPPKP